MLKIKDLQKSYNGKMILKGVNLTIDKGETLVILGRSGVGKSVLLRQIIGLEKPDQGEIFFEDLCLTNLKESELFKAIRFMGMLFQAAALFDSMTVEQNVGFYLEQHAICSAKERKNRVDETLHMVHLKGTQKMLPSELSGGMRKRVALARAIVHHPKLLLYDEPTTGLDPITAMQINDLILQIQKEYKTTSIVVTHDLCTAFHVAHTIGIHHEGTIQHLSSPQEFAKIDTPIVKDFLSNAMPDGALYAR